MAFDAIFDMAQLSTSLIHLMIWTWQHDPTQAYSWAE